MKKGHSYLLLLLFVTCSIVSRGQHAFPAEEKDKLYEAIELKTKNAPNYLCDCLRSVPKHERPPTEGDVNTKRAGHEDHCAVKTEVVYTGVYHAIYRVNGEQFKATSRNLRYLVQSDFQAMKHLRSYRASRSIATTAIVLGVPAFYSGIMGFVLRGEGWRNPLPLAESEELFDYKYASARLAPQLTSLGAAALAAAYMTVKQSRRKRALTIRTFNFNVDHRNATAALSMGWGVSAKLKF